MKNLTVKGEKRDLRVKEQSWETEVTCEINESTSIWCWKRHLPLKSERKEFSLENRKEILHLILPLAQSCCGLLSSSKQTEKQQAKGRNGSIPPRRAQVLPQLKDANPGHLNPELQVFPLHLNFHLSDVTTLLKTELRSGPRVITGQHHNRTTFPPQIRWLLNSPSHSQSL